MVNSYVDFKLTRRNGMTSQQICIEFQQLVSQIAPNLVHPLAQSRSGWEATIQVQLVLVECSVIL
jgi:hypothetical protein